MRCLTLAQNYGLAEHKQEVFGLKMRGRSAPYISETPSIGGSTTAAHLHHTHQKCGVRSKKLLNPVGKRRATLARRDRPDPTLQAGKARRRFVISHDIPRSGSCARRGSDAPQGLSDGGAGERVAHGRPSDTRTSCIQHQPAAKNLPLPGRAWHSPCAAGPRRAPPLSAARRACRVLFVGMPHPSCPHPSHQISHRQVSYRAWGKGLGPARARETGSRRFTPRAPIHARRLQR